MSSASMKRVEAAAKILRDVILVRGQGWHQAAQEALDADDAAAEYEYAMQMKDLRGDWVESDDPYIRSMNQVVWTDKESRKRLVEWFRKETDSEDYRLVKRRKAGKVEVV